MQEDNLDLLAVYLSLETKSRGRRFADTARAAEMLGLSRRTIQLWIRKGDVQAVRIGHKKYQVCLESLRERLEHVVAYDADERRGPDESSKPRPR